MTGQTPAVEFADTFNVRDLGGLGAAGAGAVRRGRFFRGASLHRLRGEDVRLFQALGVETVVDLRTDGEIDREGAFPGWLGVEVEHMPLIGNLDSISRGYASKAPLSKRYLLLLAEGKEPIRRVISILAEPERGPLAVYCSAGKDRTGVVVATILALLGVPDEEIVEDYHRSEAEVQRMMGWLRANYAEGSPEHFIFTQPAAVRLAPRAQMARFLAEARGAHGSFERYAERIGLGPEAVAALRRKLLSAD